MLPSIFHKAVPIQQRISFDDGSSELRKGVKVLDYKWAMIFTPDPQYIKCMAFFEFDLNYISVPIPVFDEIATVLKTSTFPPSLVECTDRRCSVLADCDFTLSFLREKLVTSASQQRMSIRLENNIDYYIPISNLFHEREVNKHRRCDFLIQGHKKYS